MKGMKVVIAAAIVVGSGLASPSAHAGKDYDMCMKAAAGGLHYDLTVRCPLWHWAVQWNCIAGAYSWYSAEVVSCGLQDVHTSDLNADGSIRLRKPLI